MISNTKKMIPLRVHSISELRCLTRKFATRRGSLQSSHCRAPPPTDCADCAVTVEPPTKRDTNFVNDTQQSKVVVLETLPAVPCTADRNSLPL